MFLYGSKCPAPLSLHFTTFDRKITSLTAAAAEIIKRNENTEDVHKTEDEMLLAQINNFTSRVGMRSEETRSVFPDEWNASLLNTDGADSRLKHESSTKFCKKLVKSSAGVSQETNSELQKTVGQLIRLE